MPKPSFSASRLPGFSTIETVVFVMLYAPIVTLVIYSFNAGKTVTAWEGFSWRWYEQAWSNEIVQDAALRSLTIATCAMLIATTFATLAALGTTRTGPFRGKTLISVMVNQPLVVPDIVTAISLLIFVAALKVATGYQGLGYLILARSNRI